MAGERTRLPSGVWVEYDRGCIELSVDGGMYCTICLDAADMDAFDRWRAELDADIKLRKEAGF